MKLQVDVLSYNNRVFRTAAQYQHADSQVGPTAEHQIDKKEKFLSANCDFFRKGNHFARVIFAFSSITFAAKLVKLRISKVNYKVGEKLDGPTGSMVLVHQPKSSWQRVTSAISQGSVPGHIKNIEEGM